MNYSERIQRLVVLKAELLKFSDSFPEQFKETTEDPNASEDIELLIQSFKKSGEIDRFTIENYRLILSHKFHLN